MVAAARAALPETVGDAGLVVDPTDPDEFTAALLAAACDEDLRSRLISAGVERAARFSWNRTAVLTDATLDEVLRPLPQ